jgi:hypothetical protein
VPYTVDTDAGGVRVGGASAEDVATAMELLEAARQVQADLSRLRREDLVKVTTVAGIDPTPAVAVAQARRIADLRARLVAREGGYTYASMVQTLGHANEDAARSTVSKLRRDGLFTVTYDGRTVVPAFQLAAGGRQVRPEVSEVAAALGEIDPWEAWAWWCSASSLLSGERPVDVVEVSPDRVTRAASRFAARRRGPETDAGAA